MIEQSGQARPDIAIAIERLRARLTAWQEGPLLDFCVKPTGRLVLLFAFSTLLSVTAFKRLWISWEQGWLAAIATLAIITFYPRRRAAILGAVSVIWIAYFHWSDSIISAESPGLVPPWLQSHERLLTLIAPLFLLAAMAAVRMFHEPWRRRYRQSPLLSVSFAACVLVALAEIGRKMGPRGIVLLVVIACACHFLWYILYAIRSDLAGKATLLPLIGYSIPFWVSWHAPPRLRNPDFANRFETKDDRALADAQLTAFRLIGIAIILKAMAFVVTNSPEMLSLTHGYHAALRRAGEGRPLSWHLSWIILIRHFSLAFLHWAELCYTISAIGYMAGFRAPLLMESAWESTTVAEFWNRYDVYFRYLLMDVFFFPVYFRCADLDERWRLILAIFASAGVGNFVVHYFRTIDFVFTQGVWGAAVSLLPYLFYCAVLSAGISVSRLRHPDAAYTPPTFLGRLRARIGVLTFYCLLYNFDVNQLDRTTPLVYYFKFLASLFGLNHL